MSTLCGTPTGNAVLVDHVAVAAHRHFGGAGVGALILDPIGDGLRLADDAEARRGDERDAAVAFVRVAGDQRVNRRGKAERGGVRPARRARGRR